MSSALSIDLRHRVVHVAREGHVAAKPMGGDQRSHRIEAHAGLIVSLYEAQPGISLRELQTTLAEHGVCVAQSSLSRFFKRPGLSRKKALVTRPSRIGRT